MKYSLKINLQTISDFFKSHHIQFALATGFSIILMSYFSKRVLPEPIPNLQLAAPPFIALIFEGLVGKYKKHTVLITRFGIATILFSTALVILLNS
ncbi:MAG: hypothetical protein D8M58_19185 [Calditrichaeota bacterium]|nr:MAG: hypothetical protein DWQ03_21865 [Calditrichota bacterium]MBL1207536.1 hypothetical protein [Calditrichota bacterium]NOG47368.1 hypothetical protein [Calditrichota bacterium]